MNGSCLDVVVSAPDEVIQTTRSSVTLDMLFLQSVFEVSLEYELRRITFEINLPEWLLALTDLLNEGHECQIERMLDLSGEKFIGALSNEQCFLTVFDRVTSELVQLSFGIPSARMLHLKLLGSLRQAVTAAAGWELPVSDIHRLDLLGVDGGNGI